MTATVVIEFMKKYNLSPDLTMIKILTSSTTPFLGGTSAELLPKDRLSVTELTQVFIIFLLKTGGLWLENGIGHD